VGAELACVSAHACTPQLHMQWPTQPRRVVRVRLDACRVCVCVCERVYAEDGSALGCDCARDYLLVRGHGHGCMCGCGSAECGAPFKGRQCTTAANKQNIGI
jgi:hypothetical protein